MASWKILSDHLDLLRDKKKVVRIIYQYNYHPLGVELERKDKKKYITIWTNIENLQGIESIFRSDFSSIWVSSMFCGEISYRNDNPRELLLHNYQLGGNVSLAAPANFCKYHLAQDRTED